MRSVSAIFLGSIAAVAVLTAPALAKNSQAQKADNESTSSSCNAYEQNPDGTWTQVPCQEIGSGSKAQPRSSTRSDEEAAH